MTSVDAHESGPASRCESTKHWVVRGTGVSSRLDSWSEILAATHLSFEISATHRTPPNFVAGVIQRRIADLTLVDCAAGPFRGHRGEAEIGCHGPSEHEDVLGFQFVRMGSETVREGHRQQTLVKGGIALWDGLQPTEIEILQPFCKRTLLLPRHRALAACPRLAELDRIPSLIGSSSARLLVRYLNSLVVELPQLDPMAVTTAANVALELLRAAIEPELPERRAAERTALRAEIHSYVRAHLADPNLGPAMIAQTFLMSVRALHALFEDAETSVALLVRQERLQRCFEDLMRPNGGSVTEIGFRWGFWDTAHFSRVFKRHFGQTPREVRQKGRAARQLAQS